MANPNLNASEKFNASGSGFRTGMMGPGGEDRQGD